MKNSESSANELTLQSYLHFLTARFPAFSRAAGVWRRSVSMAAWAVWRSLMSASPGGSRCLAGVSLRRWSGRWGRRRGSCSHTELPSPAPLSFRPSWDQPPSWACSSTSASCSGGCPLGEVSLWRGSDVSPVYGSTVLWADRLVGNKRCFHESKRCYIRMENSYCVCEPVSLFLRGI